MSIENLAVPLSAAFDEDGSSPLYDALTGPRSASGVRVNRLRALGYSAIWRGVNLISGDVGRIPVEVYKTTDGGKTPDREHPASRLLEHPNDYMTAFTF